jgi:HlyD family secretion protein
MQRLDRDHYTVGDTSYLLRYGMTESAEIVVRKRRLIVVALDRLQAD